jgi:hypothetical protein
MIEQAADHSLLVTHHPSLIAHPSLLIPPYTSSAVTLCVTLPFIAVETGQF